MKKIVLLLIFISVSMFGIETDVYFANGVLTKPNEAKENAKLLRKKLNRPDVPDVKVAYNHTYDLPKLPEKNGGYDFFESLRQKLSATELVDSFVSYVTDGKYTTAHKLDLDKQITQYQSSIESDKKVLVVAHSQGNLFTNEAYGAIKDMGYGDKFDAVSVASPMFSSIKSDTVTYSWDNDLVADLALNPLRKRYYCDVRKVEWVKDAYYPKTDEPAVPYVYAHYVGKSYQGEWLAKEPLINLFDSNVHAFNFYMGEALKSGDGGEIYYEVFQNRKLKTDTLKSKILEKVNEIIDSNKKIGSPPTNTDNDSTDTGDSSDTDSTNTDSNDNTTDTGDSDTTDPSSFDPNNFSVEDQCGITVDLGILGIDTAINEVIKGDDLDEICKAIQKIVDSMSSIGDGLPTGGVSIP